MSVTSQGRRGRLAAERKVLLLEMVQRQTRAICWLIQTQRGLVGPVVNLQHWKRRGEWYFLGTWTHSGRKGSGRCSSGVTEVTKRRQAALKLERRKVQF